MDERVCSLFRALDRQDDVTVIVFDVDWLEYVALRTNDMFISMRVGTPFLLAATSTYRF